MTRLLAFILFIIVFSAPLQGQQAMLNALQFEQIDSLQQVKPKPVAVFIHTDWCKYCQNMKHTTFRHEEVARRLNEDFYFISFNAEQKENITFNGFNFVYRPNGPTSGVHTLAETLGAIDGQLSYPAFVVLNSSYEIIFQHNAFINAEAMKKVLKAVVW